MSKPEMVPVIKRVDKFSIYPCKLEFDLLRWIRRELGLITLKSTKNQMMNDIARILSTMDDKFAWPEDPK